MLCQKCGERQATFHYKQNINGKKTELYLCEHCRREMAEIDFFDAGLSWNDFFGALAKGGVAQSLQKPLVCEHCGMRLEDFKNGGNLGCGYCYETFKDRLDGVLKRLHGSTKHKGRLPEGDEPNVREDEYDQSDIPALKARIKEAVRGEDYEEAARLRDIIRIIEAGDEDE